MNIAKNHWVTLKCSVSIQLHRLQYTAASKVCNSLIHVAAGQSMPCRHSILYFITVLAHLVYITKSIGGSRIFCRGHGPHGGVWTQKILYVKMKESVLLGGVLGTPLDSPMKGCMPSYFVCITISVNVITVIIGVIIGVTVAIIVIFGIIYVQPSHLLDSIYKHPMWYK